MPILGNWIDNYVAYVSSASESPKQFHFWCGATAIAATLKRNVWFDRVTYKMYPNLFTVLVGRPGLGKGAALNPALSLLKEANTSNVLSDRLTIEYVLEKLSKGFPHTSISSAGGFQIGQDTSSLIFSPELSIFITASTITLPILADLWDAREGDFHYGTRHKGEYKIASPCVSLLGGSTQEWLVDSIPSSAVGGGFTRRVNFVLGKDKGKPIPWPSVNGSSSIRTDLVDGLRRIALLKGEFTFASDAKPIFEKYHAESSPKEYDDEATAHYRTAKWAQAVKLATCISASRSNSMVITKQDFEEATTKIEEVIKDIGYVFRAVGESDLVNAADKVLTYIERKGYASRQDILKANWRHVGTAEVLDVILSTLVQGGFVDTYTQSGVLMYKEKIKPIPQGGTP